jgi:hypothetical protein
MLLGAGCCLQEGHIAFDSHGRQKKKEREHQNIDKSESGKRMMVKGNGEVADTLLIDEGRATTNNKEMRNTFCNMSSEHPFCSSNDTHRIFASLRRNKCSLTKEIQFLKIV